MHKVIIKGDLLNEETIVVLEDHEIGSCGLGEGVNCCIFITAGVYGFNCEKNSELRSALIQNKEQMSAKREPAFDTQFPECQIEGRV